METNSHVYNIKKWTIGGCYLLNLKYSLIITLLHNIDNSYKTQKGLFPKLCLTANFLEIKKFNTIYNHVSLNNRGIF